MLESAFELIHLEPNKDYFEQVINENDGPIYRIHALKDNETPVLIEPYKGDPITFPPRSFVRGAIYDIFIKRMVFDKDKCAFIGYKLKNKPYTLEI